VGITATALASGSGSTQAIKIQRGTADVPNTGTTQTAPANFTAFGSLTSAFVLNKNNRFGSADGSGVNVDDLSLRIELTATDTITFTRLATGDPANYRADWESWEYIGAPGGPNEFIVRSRNTVTITAGNRTNTATLATTPTDIDKCIPFITGISNTGTGVQSQGLTALAWISGTNTLNVERGGTTGDTVVQVVTVEFTGSNWRVGHGRTADFADVDTGTVTLYADADGQTTPFTLNNINNAIIASAQFKADDTETTNNNAIADTYPVMEISSTTQVTWVFKNGHDAVDNQIFVHVLENAGMSVTRYTNTEALPAGDIFVDITSAGVTDLTNTAIFGTKIDSGTGTYFPRGWMNYRLTSTTNAALWCAVTGNAVESRIEIAIMPQDAVTPNELVISGSTATFGTGLADTIGVGDVIQYDSDDNGSIDALAFIHGRTSSTEYTVKDKNGSAPTAVTSDYDWAIYRAYTSLANWESQTENPNITEPVENDVNPSPNLAAYNTIMNVACYGDGEDTTSAYINSWTTGPNNYIRIYTPVSPSEVGTSQRHNGTWDTSAYRISQDGGYFAPIGIRERYVRIDGLQIESNMEVGGESNGIHVSDDNADAAVEIHISNSIFRMTVASPSTAAFGIGALNGFGDVTLDNSLYVAKVWNNIIYGYTAAGGTKGTGMYAKGYGTVYAYNNTCVGGSGAAKGIAVYDSVDFYAKNNISMVLFMGTVPIMSPIPGMRRGAIP
jgi:hypothetical protein